MPVTGLHISTQVIKDKCNGTGMKASLRQVGGGGISLESVDGVESDPQRGEGEL